MTTLGRFLIAIVVAAPLALLIAVVPAPSAALAATNPIVSENQLPGSNAWRLGGFPADDATGQIKGYASATSVSQNQDITLHVSVNPAQTFSVDFFRVGWYGGLGARLVQHVGPIDGVRQPDCVPDANTGAIDCGWTASYALTVGSSWTSGVYLALLTNAQGYQNYVVFVVKDGRPGALIYQQPVNTYQAYNNYPDDGRVGKSLYNYNSYGANTLGGDRRALKASFDRPYAREGSGDFFLWEIELIRWLERSGYNVTYTTDIDTHANGGALLNSTGFLSTGHDEYWSKEMRDAAEGARDAGVSLAFFGANAVFFQVRYEASASGAANRVMVCYKDPALDPVQGPTTTTNWRYGPVNRPEQALVGVQFTNDGPFYNNAPYVVTNSSHWVYAGSGFRDGDVVPGIVGYEMDRFMSEAPGPNTTSQTLLSDSPFTSSGGQADRSNASIYRAASGAWVFATGTMSFSWALDAFDHGLADDRIQRMTANVLGAFLAGPPAVHELKVTAPATTTAGQSMTVTVVAADAQGNPFPQYNGTVHFSTSDTSLGVILPADTTLTNGQGTFTVTLVRAGPQTITVSDADPMNNLSTTKSLLVYGGPASRFVLSTTTPSPTAGAAFSFSVIAQDAYANTDASYAGTVHFTASDTSAGVVLPANTTLSGGTGTFSATLTRAGGQSVRATDTVTASITGALDVNIQPGPAAALTLATPTSAKINQPFNVTVTLRDSFGNLATSYRGTVHFSTTDISPLVKLPANYAFTAADGGAHVFSVTLQTPLSQTITVTDVANSSLSTTSGAIAVSLPLPSLP